MIAIHRKRENDTNVAVRRVSTRLAAALTVSLLWFAPAAAQQSASYRIEGAVFNAGGRPEQGTVLIGSTYRISLDAIGDPVTQRNLASASFRADSGLLALYAPPGEVTGVRFTGASSLIWDGEASVGTYQVYRGSLASLPGTDGACFLSALSDESGVDAATPSVGQGFFYLVTARNRLGEEGTKGNRSNGSERANASPCP